MSSAPKSLSIYQTQSGKQPYLNWFLSLKDKQAQAIVLRRLNRVRQGNLGDCKSLKDGLFELRIDCGPGYRIYFAQEGDKLILLLSAGDKTSQAKDIEKARMYLMDYRSNHHA